VDHQRRSCLLRIETDLLGVSACEAYISARDRDRCVISLLQWILCKKIAEDAPNTPDLWFEPAVREYVRRNAPSGQARDQGLKPMKMTGFGHAEEGDGALTIAG
jgi:hypothetical protein